MGHVSTGGGTSSVGGVSGGGVVVTIVVGGISGGGVVVTIVVGGGDVCGP